MEDFNQYYAFSIGYRDGRDKGYSEDIETILEETFGVSKISPTIFISHSYSFALFTIHSTMLS